MNNKRGFALVELAVSLVVVGIIIAAIMSGSHLLQAAKLNETVSEISGYVEAVDNFKLKYKAYPGDMPNATSFWGTYNSGSNPKGTVNGDGSETIDTEAEGLRAWQQLSLSNMINSYYSGVDAGDPDMQRDVNLPAIGAVKKGAFILSYASDIYDTSGNYLLLNHWQANTSNSTRYMAVLEPKDLHIIDSKIDDGESGIASATTGTIYGLRAVADSGDNTKCVSAYDDQSSANYVLTDHTVSCRVVVWLGNE